MAGMLALPLMGGASTSARAQSSGGDAPAAPSASSTTPSAPPPPPPVESQATPRPAPPHGKRTRVASTAGPPVATLPGFEMLADGASHLFVELTQSVQVEEKRGQGGGRNRIVYFLKQARVLHRNNENSLVTVFFNTPVERAQLLPAAGGVNLIVDLRADVTPTWKLSPGKDNSAILEVVFPKGDYVKNVGADAAPMTGGDTQSSSPGSSTPPGTVSPPVHARGGGHRRQQPPQ
jgi:hypothetical protein